MKTPKELANHYVDQWENYDIHKATDVDKILYNNGVEPDIVALSYKILRPEIGSKVEGGGVVIGIVDCGLYSLISGQKRETLNVMWGEDYIHHDVYYVFFERPVSILSLEEYKKGNPQFKEEYLEQEYAKLKPVHVLAIPGNKIQWEEESPEQESSIKEEESSVKE